jgi:hypothetical protein
VFNTILNKTKSFDMKLFQVAIILTNFHNVGTMVIVAYCRSNLLFQKLSALDL